LNSKAKTNGCLARILPLAIWCSELDSFDDVKKAIVNDVSLSHSNKIVQEIAFVYIATISYLISNPADSDRVQNAFDLAVDLSEKGIANSVDQNDSKFNCSNIIKQALTLSQ